MIIKISKHGEAIPDDLTKHFIIENENNEIHVSTSNIITQLRNLIVNGVIDNENVTIICDGEELSINKYGNIKGENNYESLYWNTQLNLDTLRRQVEMKTSSKGE